MKRTKKSRRSATVTAQPTCYICVQPGADTKDHVIPSGFFPQPLPTNLVTLPAHYSRHNRLSEGLRAGDPRRNVLRDHPVEGQGACSVVAGEERLEGQEAPSRRSTHSR